MRRLTGRCPRCDCRYPLHIHAGPTPEPKTLIFLASAPDKNRFIASRTGETGVLWCRFSRPRRKFRLKRGFPMKKLLFLLLLVPVLGWAQSPFDGTWKVDLSKTKRPCERATRATPDAPTPVRRAGKAALPQLRQFRGRCAAAKRERRIP